MNRLLTMVMLMLLSLGLSEEASAQQIRFVTDPDHVLAYQAFDSFMSNDYTGQEEEFAVTINGNTYRFKIQFRLDRTFIEAMESAEAISFFGDDYIVCWFPDSPDPLYEDLQPGLRKHFAGCFETISFVPGQRKVYDPVKGKKTATESMKFFKWNQENYLRMQASKTE